jgi:hypothetical protein
MSELEWLEMINRLAFTYTLRGTLISFLMMFFGVMGVYTDFEIASRTVFRWGSIAFILVLLFTSASYITYVYTDIKLHPYKTEKEEKMSASIVSPELLDEHNELRLRVVAQLYIRGKMSKEDLVQICNDIRNQQEEKLKESNLDDVICDRCGKPANFDNCGGHCSECGDNLCIECAEHWTELAGHNALSYAICIPCARTMLSALINKARESK